MELRLFSLFSYLLSAAYLVGWLVRQIWVLSLRGRSWWFKRQVAGKVLSLTTLSKAGNRREILLSLAGALFGCVVIPWLSQWFLKEWLLVVLVGLAMLSEEFRVSKKETQLLAVMVMLDLLQVQNEPGADLFEILAKVAREIPPGEVQKAVREAIYRRRSGVEPEKSMDALRGIDPFLDEFVLNLRLAGWQKGPLLNLALNRLLQRAGRKWDHTSRRMLVKDQLRPYIQFGRAVLISGLLVLYFITSTGLSAVWPSHSVVVWLGLMLLGSGLLFYLSLTSKWVRRSLVVLIFFVVLIPGSNAFNVQIPSWIQVQTITHSSGNIPDSWNAHLRPIVVDQAQTTFPQSKFLQGTILATQSTVLITTPTPTFSPTSTITPSVVTPTFSDMEFIEPCCHRFHQSR